MTGTPACIADILVGVMIVTSIARGSGLQEGKKMSAGRRESSEGIDFSYDTLKPTLESMLPSVSLKRLWARHFSPERLQVTEWTPKLSDGALQFGHLKSVDLNGRPSTHFSAEVSYLEIWISVLPIALKEETTKSSTWRN
jgi:hypothetical protein